MSIIQEALKRAEGKSFNNLKENPILSKVSYQRVRNPLKGIVLSLFILICLSIFLITSFLIQPKEKLSAEKIENIDVPLVEEPRENGFEKEDLIYSYTRPEPILSGIMYAGNKTLAVINDVIMSEGEKRGGLKVTKIRKDSVDIEYDGEILSLQLRR